ncbi:MAG TPA: PEFG-CTERM sorting domain-containing protein [Nitrosopumilaceae archaeon]|nr:PEFG-CTERM sorting domain-containing protein [Nitrosopumilaceae archaeon]
MSLSKIGIVLLAAVFLFPLSSVYGHGLGLDTISSVEIQGKEISISVEVPLSFDNLDEKQITITAIEDETKENAKNVTFLIGLFHENEMIFRNYFFTSDGVLPIKIKPTQEGEITIHGKQDTLLGAWYETESNPLEITGPIFNSGGLYNFEIEVRTIDEPTNIIKDSEVYNADLSVAETTQFWQKDAQNQDVSFKIKSYFDKISNFKYDSEKKRVTFEMPFDWSEKQMSHIPVVHEEVHFPNDFEEFRSGGYTGMVNGIDLFQSSVTVDDYTEEDERIVHFVLLQDHLRFLKNQMKNSGEPLPDNIIFTLSTTSKVDFPLTAYTNSEDYLVNLSWDPITIEPDKKTKFIFTIRDGSTNQPLRNSEYTFVILQGGQEIHRTTGLAQVGGESEDYYFTENQTGPSIIRFENIRNTGQETEFGILVVPEFGSFTVVILTISIMAIIIASKKNLFLVKNF